MFIVYNNSMSNIDIRFYKWKKSYIIIFFLSVYSIDYFWDANESYHKTLLIYLQLESKPKNLQLVQQF